MKREASFQSYFGQYMREKKRTNEAWELKQTTGDSIPFSSVVDHQLQALLAVKHGYFYMKIPDAGFQNPFDCFSLHGPAWIVVKYPDFFCFIDIDVWIEENRRSVRRSLTSSRAKEIATQMVPLHPHPQLPHLQ